MGKNTNTKNTNVKQSQIKEVWRRFRKNRLAMGGLIVLGFIVLMLILADFIVPYETAITMNFAEMLQKPSAKHIFGTDGYGRDLFARCLHGGRVSLLVSLSATFIAMVIGGLLGMIAGYSNNRIDNIIMRIIDIVSAIPTILLALAIVAALGVGMGNLIIAITVSSVSGFVRVTRSAVLGVADQGYIEAAKAGGTSYLRTIRKHILPNVSGTLIVQTTMNVSAQLLSISGLSFLGLGVAAPQPEWGALVAEAKEWLTTSPYLIIFPGMLILISTLTINLMGDGLRDALDPKLKN